MNTKLSGILLFATGAILGSAVTWKLVKTKYEKIAQDEIDDVVSHFSKKSENDTIDEPVDGDISEEFTTRLNNTKPDLSEYVKLISDNNYAEHIDYTQPVDTDEFEDFEDFDDDSEEDLDEDRKLRELDRIEKDILKERGEGVDESPIVISPDEFGEFRDYDLVYLSYFDDGVLTDNWDREIGHSKQLVGTNFVNHFGDYDDNVVFVRNDRLKTYYEITRDYRTFESVKDTPPHMVDD